jgi:hypothetical protein
MNTRKYPRTLTEAFGPYASGPIHDAHGDPMPMADRIVVGTCVACAAILGIFVLVGWL